MSGAAATFEFVQGNERLDWGVLVAIDLQRLIKDASVDTLQRVVENIAFARVSRDEAAMFTPEHTLHLFTLCQLVIQYLVRSQECLAKVNVRLSEKLQEVQERNKIADAAREKLQEENIILRKEVKAQRRTLVAYEYGKISQNHNNSNNNNNGLSYICPQCGDAYAKSESLQSHIRKRHTKQTIPQLQSQQQESQQSLQQFQQQQMLKSEYETQAKQVRDLQEKLNRLENLLERERERNDRLQHDSMMMMMQATMTGPRNSPQSQEENKNKSKQEQEEKQQSITVDKSKREDPLEKLTHTNNSTHEPLLQVSPEISAIPVMPDIAALQRYNMSRQQESTNNALLRQIAELEKAVRDLKNSKKEITTNTNTTVNPTTNTTNTNTTNTNTPSWLTAPGVAPVINNTRENIQNERDHVHKGSDIISSNTGINTNNNNDNNNNIESTPQVQPQQQFQVTPASNSVIPIPVSQTTQLQQLQQQQQQVPQQQLEQQQQQLQRPSYINSSTSIPVTTTAPPPPPTSSSSSLQQQLEQQQFPVGPVSTSIIPVPIPASVSAPPQKLQQYHFPSSSTTTTNNNNTSTLQAPLPATPQIQSQYHQQQQQQQKSPANSYYLHTSSTRPGSVETTRTGSSSFYSKPHSSVDITPPLPVTSSTLIKQELTPVPNITTTPVATVSSVTNNGNDLTKNEHSNSIAPSWISTKQPQHPSLNSTPFSGSLPEWLRPNSSKGENSKNASVIAPHPNISLVNNNNISNPVPIPVSINAPSNTALVTSRLDVRQNSSSSLPSYLTSVPQYTTPQTSIPVTGGVVSLLGGNTNAYNPSISSTGPSYSSAVAVSATGVPHAAESAGKTLNTRSSSTTSSYTSSTSS